MKNPGKNPRLSLVSLVALGGHDETALLAFAASLSRAVKHPLQSAILDAARERALSLEHVDELRGIVGQGVAGSVAGRSVILADATFFANAGLDTGDLHHWAERLARQGQRVMFVTIDGRPAGLLGVADEETRT